MKRLTAIKRSNLISTIFEQKKHGISWKPTQKSVDIIVRQVLKILRRYEYKRHIFYSV